MTLDFSAIASFPIKQIDGSSQQQLVHGPSVGDTMPALGELPCSLGLLEAASLSDSSWFLVLMAMNHSPGNCTDLQTPQVLWGLRAHPEHHPRRQPPAGPLQNTLLAAVRNKLSKNHLSLQNCSSSNHATTKDNKCVLTIASNTIVTHFLHAGTVLIYFIFITIFWGKYPNTHLRHEETGDQRKERTYSRLLIGRCQSQHFELRLVWLNNFYFGPQNSICQVTGTAERALHNVASQEERVGTFLVIQRLTLLPSNTGGTGSILGASWPKTKA